MAAVSKQFLKEKFSKLKFTFKCVDPTSTSNLSLNAGLASLNFLITGLIESNFIRFDEIFSFFVGRFES